MSSLSDKTGGPAFPHYRVLPPESEMHASKIESVPGLTMRDYFAAAALTGLLASGNYNHTHESDAASDALGYADAMIAARLLDAASSEARG